MLKATTMAIALAATALTVAGCSQAESDAPTAEANADQPMAEALESAADMGDMAEMLRETGLATVFEGAGSYTLLAPKDAAFDALDATSGAALEENRAALAALVAHHMLPGYVDMEGITAAIDKAQSGKVTMQTLGNSQVTFGKSGETIVVTAADGTSASISGDAIPAGASIALPLDGLLRKL